MPQTKNAPLKSLHCHRSVGEKTKFERRVANRASPFLSCARQARKTSNQPLVTHKLSINVLNHIRNWRFVCSTWRFDFTIGDLFANAFDFTIWRFVCNTSTFNKDHWRITVSSTNGKLPKKSNKWFAP